MNGYSDGLKARDRIPLLWLCGPPGVGKTTVGWQFFSQLSQDGIKMGYLDIDQLGMCYPAPVSDPDRHHIKSQNLGAMVTTFKAAGAQCMLVSGVVDETHGIRDYADQISHTALTLCRLRADHDILTQRLASRGLQLDQMRAMLHESDILDHSNFADICIDTSKLTVSEIIEHVREKTGQWPTLKACPPNHQAPTTRFPKLPTTPGSILWLCGTTGVGKSTVGWRIFEKVRQAGITAAFVDLEQIGFYRPLSDDDPDNHQIKAHNLAAMWQTFYASGAQYLIVVGAIKHVDTIQTYANVLPNTSLTLCRLHANAEQLKDRILKRGQGIGPRLPGDALNGQPITVLQKITREAIETREILQHNAIGNLCINTDNRTIEEVAQMILAKINFK